MTFQDITHPDDLELDLDFVRQLKGGEIDSFTIEKRQLRKDGGVNPVQLTSALVRDGDGTPVYALRQVQQIGDTGRARGEGKGIERPLSDREREILTLTANGNTNEQIGSLLEISAETVQTYVRRAMKKLEAGPARRQSRRRSARARLGRAASASRVGGSGLGLAPEPAHAAKAAPAEFVQPPHLALGEAAGLEGIAHVTGHEQRPGVEPLERADRGAVGLRGAAAGHRGDDRPPPA
jgi:PAS domain-containing protein